MFNFFHRKNLEQALRLHDNIVSDHLYTQNRLQTIIDSNDKQVEELKQKVLTLKQKNQRLKGIMTENLHLLASNASKEKQLVDARKENEKLFEMLRAKNGEIFKLLATNLKLLNIVNDGRQLILSKVDQMLDIVVKLVQENVCCFCRH